MLYELCKEWLIHKIYNLRPQPPPTKKSHGENQVKQ
jgi:hypothetical protein